jgi:hypothetical protein
MVLVDKLLRKLKVLTIIACEATTIVYGCLQLYGYLGLCGMPPAREATVAA